MRILLLFVALFLLIVCFVFGYSNSTPVTVDVFGTPIATQIGYVGVVALALGALLIAAVAVIEGASMRFENRRLLRDIRRLETEINFLRTQPAPAGQEPDTVERPAATSSRRTASQDTPPSAPVYGVKGTRPAHDDEDDDVYTGGSAV